MDEKQRRALEVFSQQKKVVAVVEPNEIFWRNTGQQELKKRGLDAIRIF